MRNEYDYFELDDLNQEMGKRARQFNKARINYVALPVSPERARLLAIQNGITQKIAPLQNQVAQMLIDGNFESAEKLLTEQALPGQTEVLEKIGLVIELDSLETDASINELAAGIEKSGYYFVLLGILMGGISMLIVVTVLTRTSRKEKIQLDKTLVEREQHSRNLAKARDEAEAATIAKSQFLATMSHEIRTPMNAVIGMTQLLEDTNLNDQQKDYLSTIDRSSNSLLSLINDILDFSKLEANMTEIESIVFDLERVCQESMELVSGNVAKKGLEFILDYDPDCHRHFNGDPSRIRQVLLNILGNAVKFTQEGYVRLGVSYEKGDSGREQIIHLQIQDTGIGLKPDAMEHLFDEFTQADNTTTRQYGGTGLGLAITKKLIDLMGGEIEVESVFGEGTIFRIKIFLVTAEVLVPPGKTSLEAVRVLLVEDQKEYRAIFKRMLEHMGVHVTTMSEPTQTLDHLHSASIAGDPYKIVILNYNMPEISGMELCINIRKSPEFKELKLLMLSSVTDQGDTAILARAGFDAYLNKLTRYNTLKAMLSAMLNHSSGQPIITQHSIDDAEPQDTDVKFEFKGFILLVEDILANQLIAKKFIMDMGHKVDVATNGEQAVEAFKNYNYDLIFMDCRMPVMDGYKATHAIRQIEKEIDRVPMPIIALTANATSEDRSLCEQSGMDDIVTKPYRRNDLYDCLRQWLPHAADSKKGSR